MMKYDKIFLGKQARELGFVRDTFEKVCRLADILKFIENDSLLKNKIALKGGTAINLTMMDLPRLSVDIDLDYVGSLDKNKTIKDREEINIHIAKYMEANGYKLSQKSKSYYALESKVYDYQNAGGIKDNLKIEINYMLRTHILCLEKRQLNLSWIKTQTDILCVNTIEIFSTKIVALLTRAAARDLYDVYNMIKFKLFQGEDINKLEKCVAFYSAISTEHAPLGYNLDNIENITQHKIRTDLYPVLKNNEKFNLREVQEKIKTYFNENIHADELTVLFWKSFNNKIYKPELLFNGTELERVKEHPMAIWKCMPKNSPTNCGRIY